LPELVKTALLRFCGKHNQGDQNECRQLLERLHRSVPFLFRRKVTTFFLIVQILYKKKRPEGRFSMFTRLSQSYLSELRRNHWPIHRPFE